MEIEDLGCVKSRKKSLVGWAEYRIAILFYCFKMNLKL